jgi:hypothetical protein
MVPEKAETFAVVDSRHFTPGVAKHADVYARAELQLH